MLEAWETALTEELPIFHHQHFVSQAFRFVHGVRSQDHTGGLLLLFDGVPHEALGLGIHARAGFVQEDHFGVANHGDGHLEFAFVAARVLAGQGVAVHAQVHHVHQGVHVRLELRA